MDIGKSNEIETPMIPVFKDGKFCSCRDDLCDCGENFTEYEWVWDTESVNPETVVLSCENRETMFHPRSSEGTSAIRGARPFQQGHVYYWEIKILSSMYGTDFVVGVGTKNALLTSHQYCSLIGHDKESWGYSYYGRAHHNGENWSYGHKFDKGSIIGVKLDMWRGHLEFFLNRKPLGVAFTKLNKHPELYPLVSSTAAKSSIRMIHSTSHSVNLMHHCLVSLQNQFQETRGQLSGIPNLRRFTERSWWNFSDDEVLYPNNARNKAYHWHLDSTSPEVTLENLLCWNVKRRVQTANTEARTPWPLLHY